MPRPIIIDTDPGQDDAVALLVALASPDDLEVLGITTVGWPTAVAARHPGFAMNWKSAGSFRRRFGAMCVFAHPMANLAHVRSIKPAQFFFPPRISC